jgi:hypothetical protein
LVLSTAWWKTLTLLSRKTLAFSSPAAGRLPQMTLACLSLSRHVQRLDPLEGRLENTAFVITYEASTPCNTVIPLAFSSPEARRPSHKK